MTEFTSHRPGTLSWVELATTDQKAGVGVLSRAVRLGGCPSSRSGRPRSIRCSRCAARRSAPRTRMRADERQSGVPPHWNLYVTVASVDDSARRAQELGGTLLAPPFDVMDAGRMAVLQDPTGAIFQVWQAKRSIGAKILGEPGALCWTELTTRDPKARKRSTPRSSAGRRSTAAPTRRCSTRSSATTGQPGMGMMKMPEHMPAHVPSYWMPYFQVADCDAATAKATGLGANVIVPPQDIPPTGRFSILSDPQGAMLRGVSRSAG